MASHWLAAAQAICGADYVVDGPAIEPRYLEPARYAPGCAAGLVRPATGEQVAALVRLCIEHALVLVPQGAHTGLVRAGTPTDGERHLLLSTDRLREVFEFDPLDRTLRVSAGYRLSEVNERLAEHGLSFAVDLSADPSIGGMLAHNTGGTRMLRHGDVRANVLGLTAVLGEGQVLRLGRGLQKDNAGLALQQLLIGSSGALGIVCEAVLRLQPLPRQRAVALVAVSSLDAVFPLYQQVMGSELAGLVSAFEGISRPALEAGVRGGRSPFEGPLPEYALLIELASELPAARLNLNALLLEQLEQAFGTLVADAVVGADEAIWGLRHSISEGLREQGRVIGFDISLPRRYFMRFRAEASAWLASEFPPARVADFGHLGDGGLHFNLVWPHGEAPPDAQRLRDGVYAIVAALGGSFSAEHGVGPQVQDSYWAWTDPAVQALSGAVERVFDPRDIFGTTCFGPKNNAIVLSLRR
ncbi:FAD-binding oxidoreductase [Pelomonas sp. KK5]|uniref:FAD-binding oxidoreductase n=1 Tax=Pelomonas sp. KK5 TaxID=1855730 RepID=UPI00097BC0CF|nr:FAD-binding oxidoreductase [Pelomonas sp. KK5]